MVEIGGKPILWHILKMYSHHGINDFIICCGYKGYLIKEYFANYFLHMSDVTFDMSKNSMEVHQRNAEPWKVTLVDTGEDTMTGGRVMARRTRADLLTDIGLGRKIASIVAKRLARLLTEHGARPDAVTLTMGRYGLDESTPAHSMVLIDGSEGLSVQLATCCRPIPGDSILGYLGRGEGLLIHTTECSVGKRLFDRDSEGWLNVDWAEQPTRAFETGVSLLLRNGKGVFRSKDGYVFDGVWKDGHIAGTGTLTYPDGSVYVGALVEVLSEGMRLGLEPGDDSTLVADFRHTRPHARCREAEHQHQQGQRQPLTPPLCLCFRKACTPQSNTVSSL